VKRLFSIAMLACLAISSGWSAVPTTEPAGVLQNATIRVNPNNAAGILSQATGIHTFEFESGIYRGGIVIPAKLSGSTFRAVSPWQACVIGDVHGISILPNVQNITITGFRVCAPRGCGVYSLAKSGVTIEDCYVHSCGQSGIYGLHHSLVVRRCLIERNGLDPIHDHGVYIGNKPSCVVDGCVIRHNAGLGIGPALGSQQMSIRNNLIHNNGAGGISWPVYSISSGKPSELINNTIMDNGNNPDIRISETGTSSIPCLVATGNSYRRIQWDGTVNATEKGQRRLNMSESLQGYYQGEDGRGWSVAAIDRTQAYCTDPATGTGAPRVLVGGQ